MTLPERMVEAAARAVCRVQCPGAHPCDMEATHCKADKCSRWHIYVDDARAALTAALAVAEAEGAGLFLVPEERRFLSGEGEHVDSANAGAAGHNTCRAAILAGRVTL